MFNEKVSSRTRRDGRTEPQSLVSAPNIPGLNSKSLSSVYDVKACVLLIAICPSDGIVKPGGPLDTFRK